MCVCLLLFSVRVCVLVCVLLVKFRLICDWRVCGCVCTYVNACVGKKYCQLRLSALFFCLFVCVSLCVCLCFCVCCCDYMCLGWVCKGASAFCLLLCDVRRLNELLSTSVCAWVNG